MNLIRLISAKYLTKHLPSILAYILTKSLTWLFNKYPTQKDRVLKEAGEMITALQKTIDYTKDGVITKEELSSLKLAWEKAIRL